MIPRIDSETVESVFSGADNGPGLLVSIVGFDGSGKTTQVEALAEKYRELGRDVLTTHQPTEWYRNADIVQKFHYHGGSASKARILSLFAATDRLLHVNNVIEPALKEGKVVIIDRYVYATFGVFVHRGVDPKFVASINHGIPKPDHAFYLEVPVTELMQRLHVRDGDNLQFEELDASRIESIVRTYREMGDSLINIDGTLPVDDVTKAMTDCMGI